MAEKEKGAQRPVKPEQIQDSLRLDIVTRVYKDGDKLVESDIAQKYGASRGSVRSALAALESEGLVRMLPNGRKEVVGFTVKQVCDMYELRWMMENRALELAIENRTTFFSPLLTVLRTIEQKMKAPEGVDWYGIDIEFHRALVMTSGNYPLLKAWDINTPVMYALMQLNTSQGYRERYVQELYEKHRRIFELLVTDNLECYALLREHIMDAQEISLQVLSRYGE